MESNSGVEAKERKKTRVVFASLVPFQTKILFLFYYGLIVSTSCHPLFLLCCAVSHELLQLCVCAGCLTAVS